VLDRIKRMAEKVNDPQLESARQKAEAAANIESQESCELEDVQRANNDLLDAKKLMNKARQENLKTIRQMELDSCTAFFNEVVRQYAKNAEAAAFDNLARTAQRSIDRNDNDFDNILDSMKSKNFSILIRQDWFIVDWYQRITSSKADFLDQARFFELKRQGDHALSEDDIGQLRSVLFELLSIRVTADSGDNMFDIANIVKG